MKSFRILVLTIGFLAVPGFVTGAFAGQAALKWQEAGKPPLKKGTIFSCGQPQLIDIKVSYSLNDTFVIGDYDPYCPSGFGANPFRYTVSLYRDGSLLDRHRFRLSSCWFRDWFVSIPAAPGKYHAKIEMERRLGPWVWRSADSLTSPSLFATKQKATPNFTINGHAIPQGGAPLTVSIMNPIVMDGSTTTCATNYYVGVSESERWWNRTLAYEWGKWSSGEPPAHLNLQQLSTTYSVPPTWLGNDPSRQGTPIFGGMLANLQPRFYRVGLCTAEPSWECRESLIRVK